MNNQISRDLQEIVDKAVETLKAHPYDLADRLAVGVSLIMKVFYEAIESGFPKKDALKKLKYIFKTCKKIMNDYDNPD